MRTRLILSLAVVLCSQFALAADPAAVWEIGKTDGDYRDLAIAGDHNAYPKAFPKDVDYVISKSDPAKDFSFIHPGPTDPWAGNRPHAVRISFELAAVEAGAYELRIDLVDTQGAHAPTLRVDVNGQHTDLPLETGTGDISLVRPDKGKRRNLKLVFGADTLKQGGNRIELTSVGGSWMLYDAVSLWRTAADTRQPIQIKANASIFFVERDGKLQQEISVAASNILSAGPVKVEVRSGEQLVGSAEFPKATLGAVSSPMLVDDTSTPRELTVKVTAGDQSGTAQLTQKAQRKWQIYVAPATHTDIGYTEFQSRVIELHNRNTDLALELAEEFPLYHWNLESSWAAQMWLRERPAYRHEAIFEASRQKRIGIEASYLNMLTGLCSEEELIRTMYYSARLNREHGVPFESYTLTDAPSHVWTTPTILRGAGIKYLSVGINGTRAPILKHNIHHKSPFWWEGPDGSKILTWFAVGYSQAGQIGLREGAGRMRSAIERDLYWWDHRTDYPYDAILLHGAYSDNVSIGRDIAESLAAYSKQYAYPKVILCANNHFFEHIEKNFADKIPTVRGCGGSWWEDGAGSTAIETGICRVTHQQAVTAEAVWAAVTKADAKAAVPQERFDRVWDNILLYDEHTWGAYNSISEPTSDFVTRQWAVKAAYAVQAAEEAQRLLQEGLVRLASCVAPPAEGESLLVFNPSGRPRGGLVRAQLPRGVVVMDGDKVLPQQTIREDKEVSPRKGKRKQMPFLTRAEVVFELPKEVPAVGYAAYHLASAEDLKTLPTPKRFDGKVLENDFYKVTFDTKTGGISSLLDKKLGKELVDSAGKYTLGQVIYAAGGGNKKPDGREDTQVECPNPAEVKFTSPTKASIEPGLSGALLTSARTVSSVNPLTRIEMEVVLYEHHRKVDFTFRMHKHMVDRNKEAVYIAFPFAGTSPQFRYEIGGGSVRPNEDQFPGSCRDWFSVQRWVTVNTDNAGVAWSPLDTPLAMFCDIQAGKWLDTLAITNGTVFAYAMNNYWCTNYKAGQGGDRDEFVFRYSLTSDASMDSAAASLFGETAVAPLEAVIMPPVAQGISRESLASSHGFCQVTPETVTLTTIKQADDGKGLIVRVRETSGKPAEVKIATRFGWKNASRCDLVERVQEPLPGEGGAVTLKLGANAIATVRFE